MAVRQAWLCLLAGLVFSSVSAWADGIVIDHREVGCVVAGRFPQLLARFDPAENVARARVAFRPTGGLLWYSVPMKQDGYNFIGLLPQPEKRLKKFDYYITVADKAFSESRTQEFSPDVVSGPAACQGNKVLASALVKAKAVLVNPPAGVANAAKVPLGFSANGVIAGAGSASGTSTAAAGAGGAGGGAAVGAVASGAAAGGLSGAAIAGIVVGGAAVAGGGVALATHKSAPPTTLPPSVTGTWVGTATVTWTGSIPATNCSGELDSFTLTLVQSGGGVSGTRHAIVTTAGTCGDGSQPARVGAGAPRPITGTANPPDITFSGVCASSGTATWVGKISGNSMDGTVLCNPLLAEDPTARNSGSWHVTKQ